MTLSRAITVKEVQGHKIWLIKTKIWQQALESTSWNHSLVIWQLLAKVCKKIWAKAHTSLFKIISKLTTRSGARFKKKYWAKIKHSKIPNPKAKRQPKHMIEMKTHMKTFRLSWLTMSPTQGASTLRMRKTMRRWTTLQQSSWFKIVATLSSLF